MLAEAVRDSFLGQTIRQVHIPSWLRYDEEQTEWQAPAKLSDPTHDDGKPILVDWYGETDKEDPQNWSQLKKAFVLLVIGAYSFVVYMAAPIYTPSVNAFREEFNVNGAEGSLGLAIYVYGAQSTFLLPHN